MCVENKRKRDTVSYRIPPVNGEEDTNTNYDDLESDSDFIPGKGLWGQQKARQSKKAKLDTHSSKTHKPFPFLLLPPELRDLIYEFALSDPSGLHLIGRQGRNHRTIRRISETSRVKSWSLHNHAQQNLSGNSNVTQLSPNLLATNKQIHLEAISKLYGRPICVDNTKTLHTFLTLIRPTNRRHLREITIQAWGEGHGVHKTMNHAALDLLADSVNIKNLTVKGHFLRWRGGAPGRELARSVFRDAQFLLDTMAVLHGRDAALGIIELDFPTADGRSSCYIDNLAVNGQNLSAVEYIKQQYDNEMRVLLDSSLKRIPSK